MCVDSIGIASYTVLCVLRAGDVESGGGWIATCSKMTGLKTFVDATAGMISTAVVQSRRGSKARKSRRCVHHGPKLPSPRTTSCLSVPVRPPTTPGHRLVAPATAPSPLYGDTRANSGVPRVPALPRRSHEWKHGTSLDVPPPACPSAFRHCRIDTRTPARVRRRGRVGGRGG